MATIFDGKELARQKLSGLAKLNRGLTMAGLYMSGDPGSALYTRLKKQAAESIGVKFTDYDIQGKTTAEITTLIKQINSDTKINGVLVQKPSGENNFSALDWSIIASAIDPKKDIDGLTPENLGLLAIGTPRFIPATVKAVLSVIEESGITLPGKKVVIIGASEILGKPLSLILTDRGATVSILHRSTGNIENYTREADLLISATGSPGLIGLGDVKPGSVVIDVGAPRGDVKTEEVQSVVAFLSPGSRWGRPIDYRLFIGKPFVTITHTQPDQAFWIFRSGAV